MRKYTIGISIGDINGIGPEVILKAFDNRAILKSITPIIYGSTKVLTHHKNMTRVETQFVNTKDVANAVSGKLNVIACGDENVEITLGKATKASGQYAIDSLNAMVRDAKEGVLDAIVTAPINKHAMQLAGWGYPGHTEFLGRAFGADDQLMFMISDSLKVATVTGHIPLSQIGKKVTKEKIVTKINLLNDSLIKDFGFEKPKIAVLGLNPHAGDGGAIGSEEVEMITPLIMELKKKGMLVSGSYPADGFFGSSQFAKVDATLAMYHDQGLIPFKALSFNKGVNYTAGLDVVRTSPDHGTAYTLAGKDQASPNSFRQALYAAIDIKRSRDSHQEMNANPLKKSK